MQQPQLTEHQQAALDKFGGLHQVCIAGSELCELGGRIMQFVADLQRGVVDKETCEELTKEIYDVRFTLPQLVTAFSEFYPEFYTTMRDVEVTEPKRMQLKLEA